MALAFSPSLNLFNQRSYLEVFVFKEFSLLRLLMVRELLRGRQTIISKEKLGALELTLK